MSNSYKDFYSKTFGLNMWTKKQHIIMIETKLENQTRMQNKIYFLNSRIFSVLWYHTLRISKTATNANSAVLS